MQASAASLRGALTRQVETCRRALDAVRATGGLVRTPEELLRAKALDAAEEEEEEGEGKGEGSEAQEARVARGLRQHIRAASKALQDAEGPSRKGRSGARAKPTPAEAKLRAAREMVLLRSGWEVRSRSSDQGGGLVEC